ncbi:hypothetical protein ABPG74_016801 [Tetrahymena malaccensis]
MIVDYSDSDPEPEFQKKRVEENANSKIFAIAVNVKPDVNTQKLEQEREENRLRQLNQIYNSGNGEQNKKINHLTGKVESYNMHSFSFDQQFYNFKNRGYAYDPQLDTNRIVVNDAKFPELAQVIHYGGNVDPTMLDTKGAFISQSNEEKQKQKQLKSLREKTGTVTDGTYAGPWANYQGENIKPKELTQEEKLELEKKKIEEQEEAKLKKEKKRKQKLKEKGFEIDDDDDKEDQGKEKGKDKEENAEQQEEQVEGEGQTEEVKKQKDKSEVTTSIFHDAVPYFDYKGRSYLQPPIDLKPRDHVCYIPKKQVHCWSGHEKGVQAIRFFPKYGHYLLSASLDSTVKLWDVMGNKKCVRTYMGHKQAVRDIEFTNDGRHFLSCSYDKNVLYWDTETGKILRTFNIKKYPYQARFNPDEGKQSSFILASSNKKVLQYDVRSGARTQVYDEHLGAVNTVTFVDYGRKFVSTSDDKKIFLWGFGIGVVEKHIAEPDMTAVANTNIHPTEKFFAGQCSDNKIQIYDTKGGNFRLNKKKLFKEHVSSGYAIGLDFSPDGQFLCSGDAEGRAYFWDWKSGKNYKVIQAHDQVCIDIRWHPIETSKVATCGWDGLIKYWD